MPRTMRITLPLGNENKILSLHAAETLHLAVGTCNHGKKSVASCFDCGKLWGGPTSQHLPFLMSTIGWTAGPHSLYLTT